MNTFRIIKIRDPRTPGFCWWEIHGTNSTTAETWCAAVCDTLEHARDMMRHMKASVPA